MRTSSPLCLHGRKDNKTEWGGGGGGVPVRALYDSLSLCCILSGGMSGTLCAGGHSLKIFFACTKLVKNSDIPLITYKNMCLCYLSGA